MASFFKRYLKIPSSTEKPARFSRILITGMGKTGSTALYYAILNSLPPETVCLFEPEFNGKILPEDIAPPVLVKSFIPYSEHFSFFEKKILLVRDPRDQMISSVLYKPYNILAKEFPGDLEGAMALINSYLESVRLKEVSPLDVSVKKLFDTGQVKTLLRINNVMEYSRNHSDLFLLKYEDFIDQNLKGLNEYLNIDITGSIEVPQKYKRVVRTKSYGNWRSWFTPSDVEYFRPLMRDYMDRFGYKDDWELAKEPAIDPEQGSHYLEGLIREALDLRRKRNI